MLMNIIYLICFSEVDRACCVPATHKPYLQHDPYPVSLLLINPISNTIPTLCPC